MSAIEDFREGVQEVLTLAELASRAPEGNGLKGAASANALRRGATVLLVSHFESFLKALAEEYIDIVDSGQFIARELPVGLRELHSLSQLESIVTTNDDNQRRALLGKLSPIALLWNAEAKIPRRVLSAEKLARQVTSAMPDTIDRVFQLMGARVAVCDGELDYEDRDQEVQGLVIRRALNDIVTLRNKIAHGGASSPVPTSDDLDRYVRFLLALSVRLERTSRGLLRALDEKKSERERRLGVDV